MPFTNFATVSNSRINSLKKVKQRVIRDTEYKRTLMSRFFKTGTTIKSLAKKVARNQEQVHSQENLSRKQAKKINNLSEKLKTLRGLLSKRMKTIYKINELGYLRILMNNFQAGNFDKNMIYFKKFISQDMNAIAQYNKVLAQFNKENLKLKNKIKKLLAQRKSFKKSEIQLEAAQKTRVRILKKLRDSIDKNQNFLAEAVSKEEIELLSSLYKISFFEKKGRMISPINAKVAKAYGLYNDSTYNIRFLNKGLTFSSKEAKPVSAIFDGTVEFAGEIPGHGNTIIINHKDEYYSVYSFLNMIHLYKGDTVSQGQYLANNTKLVGSHYQLYFEIRHYSEHLNPQHWIQKNSIAIH